MILLRLRLRNFRRFDREVAAEFHPEINLIVGPNESGKTSLVLAVPFLLFTPHTSQSAARAVQPYGRPLAPWIQAEIQHEGRRYRLTKGFGSHRESRVERWDEADRRWHILREGREADQWMADLFRASLAGRLQGFPTQWGLAHLLWLVQFPDQDPAPARVDPRLRNHPEVQSVEATDLARLLARLEAELAPLVTPAQRQPRAGGPLRQLLDDLMRLEQTLQTWEQKVKQIQQVQESLHHLEQEQAALIPRIQQVEARLAERHKDLERWEDLKRQRQIRQMELQAARETARQLEQQFQEAQDLWETLEKLRKRLRDLSEDREVLREKIRQQEAVLQDLEQRERTEATRAQHLERERQRLQDLQTLHHLERRLKTLQQQRKRVAALQATLQRARSVLDQGSPEELQGLQRAWQKIQQQIMELRGRLQGLALQVHLEALGDLADLRINDQPEPLSAGEHRLLEVPPEVTVELPDQLRLRVRPAGAELQRLQQRLRELQEEQGNLLHRAGVNRPEDLQERLIQAQQALRTLQQAREELQTLPPLKELDREIRTLQARLAEAPTPLPPLAELEVELQARQKQYEESQHRQQDLRRQIQEAQQALQQRREDLQQLEQDLIQQRTRQQERQQRLVTLLSELDLWKPGETFQSSRVQRALEALAQRVQEAHRRVRALEKDLTHLERQMDALDPGQELEQLQRRLEDLRQEQARLQGEIHRRQGELEALQAEDPLRKKLQAEAERHRVRQQLNRVLLRTEALLWLKERAEEMQRQRSQVLETFLTQRVEHLWNQITGQHRRLRMEEGVWKVSHEGEEPRPLRVYLSSGAEEQLALALRLAYGLALAEMGDRQMVVLDDALVFSDPERFDRILGLLQHLRQHLQILILTSHPERYSGLPAHRLDTTAL